MKKYGLLMIMTLIFGLSNGQSNSGVKVGAYFFGGWTLDRPNNNFVSLTQALVDSFPERKPVWGWVPSSQKIMETQIDLAADAGLSFFSFCWYYNDAKTFEHEPLNKDLHFYLTAANSNRIKFNLAVINDGGHVIGPNNWAAVVDIWIKLFKNNNYLKVDDKPLLTFFNMPNLIKTFGSADAVKSALDSLRAVARSNGLNGVTIAVCIPPTPSIAESAVSCGFDVFTNYCPLPRFNGITNDVDDLLAGDMKIWDGFLKLDLPYIPVTALNYDPRPWRKNPETVPHYTGYSARSIYKSVVALERWVNRNKNHTTKDKIALIYAWNEYGEGGWLTPSDKFNPLDALRKAISDN